MMAIFPLFITVIIYISTYMATYAWYDEPLRHIFIHYIAWGLYIYWLLMKIFMMRHGYDILRYSRHRHTPYADIYYHTTTWILRHWALRAAFFLLFFFAASPWLIFIDVSPSSPSLFHYIIIITPYYFHYAFHIYYVMRDELPPIRWYDIYIYHFSSLYFSFW